MNKKDENKQKQTNRYPTETEIQNLIQGGEWEKIKKSISNKECGFFGNSDMTDEERDFYRTLMLELINSENIPKEDLNPVIFSLLTERNRKAFLNFKDNSGNNLLHLCVLKEKEEIASLSFEKIKGSNDFVKFLLFEKNKQGSTSIELADNNRQFQQLIQKFVQTKYGFWIERVFGIGKYFEKALFTAVENNKQNVVEFLLDADINPHRCNEKGQSLLDIAEEKGYSEITDLLRKKEVKNATYKHAFWESFKSGATHTTAWTVVSVACIGAACAMIAAIPLLIIFAHNAAPAIGGILLLSLFAFGPENLPYCVLALSIAPAIVGVSIGAIIGGILSLVTAPIGGLIDGVRIVFNKKIHESQKRQEASTSPLVVENEDNQLPFIQSAGLGCNTQPAVNTAEKKSWFSFWKPSDATVALPAEDAARVLSHSHF